MKRILLIIAITIASIYAYGQNYYYYRGNKLMITENSNLIVQLSSTEKAASNSTIEGFSLVTSVTNNSREIKIFQRNSSSSDPSVLGKMSRSIVMPCYIDERGEDLIPNGHFNVKLKSTSDYPLLKRIAEEKKCEILSQNEYMPLWYNLRITEFTNENSVEIANSFYETGLFEASFPSFTIDALEISYDPYVTEQWNLYNSVAGVDISVSPAWNYATGRGIKIAIIDEGVDLYHCDLVENIYPLSFDVESNSSPSQLYGSHGTHCAGIAAAVRNNDIQVAGVAPDAKIISVSCKLILGDNLENKLANAINWAWQRGADVISCSWWCRSNELIENAIDNAVTLGREGKGCIFVKSAGNTAGSISYPGNYSPDVLAVANIDKFGEVALSSGSGPNLFVAAPGSCILSTVPNDQVARDSGTSMACPHVSGVAALILERNPNLTAKEVREIIALNAKKIGSLPYSIIKQYGAWNERYGYGLVDAYQAVINTPRK